MSLKGEQEAILVVAPTAAGSGDIRELNQTTITNPGSAPQDLGIDIPSVGAWFTFRPTVACAIVFGPDVGMDVADANSYPLNAGEEWHRYIEPGITSFMSVFKTSDEDPDGTLFYYTSQSYRPNT